MIVCSFNWTGWRLAVLSGSAALALALIAGPAAAQQWKRSNSPEEMLFRLDQIAAEIAEMRGALGGVPSAVRPGGVTTGGETAALEAEIRRLTNQVELLQRQLSQMAANTKRRLDDAEFRLNEIEGTPNATAAGSQPLITTNPGAGGGASIEGTLAPDVAISERGDLDRAINDVNQGRFDQAEDRLRQFINTYPNSPLRGEAWFWLGESQFVRGNLPDASKSYLNGYRANQRGEKAPDSLLKLGVTLGRLGLINEACRTLRQVGVQFPNATAGVRGRADAEADNLTCG